MGRRPGVAGSAGSLYSRMVRAMVMRACTVATTHKRFWRHRQQMAACLSSARVQVHACVTSLPMKNTCPSRWAKKGGCTQRCYKLCQVAQRSWQLVLKLKTSSAIREPPAAGLVQQRVRLLTANALKPTSMSFFGLRLRCQYLQCHPKATSQCHVHWSRQEHCCPGQTGVLSCCCSCFVPP